MSYLVISGTATAISPLVHGGESAGTVMEFRREKVIVDGRVEMLPAISGNAIRGQLRDACALFSLQASGLDKVRLSTFHLLFSGGSLVKTSSENYINLLEEKKIRELIPAVSIFGGSVGNRVLGGKLDVGQWTPICREAKMLLPEEFQAEAEKVSIYDLLDIISFTRRDDANTRRLQNYIPEDELQVYRASKAAKQEAREPEDKGASQQMRYSYECLASGTKLAVDFALHNVNDVELGTFLGGLAIFATRPTVGGRASTGLGRVKLDLKQIEFGKPAVVIGEIAAGKIEAAQKHLAERAEQVREFLEAL